MQSCKGRDRKESGMLAGTHLHPNTWEERQENSRSSLATGFEARLGHMRPCGDSEGIVGGSRVCAVRELISISACFSF